MFIDEASIVVEGGRGGDGCVSFAREKYRPRGGTDGGGGADGGDVLLEACGSRSTLAELNRKRQYRAGDGGRGSSNNRTGRRGKDLHVQVPCGTVARGAAGEVLADLVADGQTVVVAPGGSGGRGNASLTGVAGKLPSFAEKGAPGEIVQLFLELKLVADVALVGLPNAGKSTLISRISAARPKVADYPFTTLEPNLGAVEGEDIEYVVTDVPGLVKGAHAGKGMGDHFLRHVERASAIVYLVDMSPDSGREPREDLEILREEMGLFNPALTQKRSLVAANKMDLGPGDDELEPLELACRERGLELLRISSASGQGITELKRALESMVAAAREAREPAAWAGIVLTPPASDEVKVEKLEGGFLVRNRAVERMVSMTDWSNDEAREFLSRMLRKTGVDEALAAAGAEEGDEVEIAGRTFGYVPEPGRSRGGEDAVGD